MAKKKKTKRAVEFRISIDEFDIVAVPMVRNAELDRLLARRGALSFVFIPLAQSGKKKRTIDKAAAKARNKAQLPADDWHSGEMRVSDCRHSIPGVFGLNVRRQDARSLAEKVGVKQFFWGTSGAPVEEHVVKIFEVDDSQAWKDVRGRAIGGLLDMFDTARNIGELPTAVAESQTTMQRFRQLVFVVIGVCAGAGLLSGYVIESLGTVARIALYPVILPAILIGVYLRVLVRKGEAQARDFTAAEAEQNWRKVAPHLLALWALCWIAVAVLTWFQTVPGADFPFVGSTGDLTTSFIICVWMLLPIANSRDVQSLLSSGFEAGVAAAVSIITIKISLYVTDLITDALWGLLAALLPFSVPERLKQLIDFVIDIGAEVFFVAVLLGYAWLRTRQQFTRL